MQRLLSPTSIALLLLAWAAAIGAQAPATVWSGVYTAEQAARGKTAYDANCSGCHGPYLEGFRTTGSAKALAREPFLDRWDGGTVDELYQFIRDNMPKSTAAIRSDSVPDSAKVDIVAYILQVNEFPAGSSPLSPSNMAGVLIQSKGGIKTPKNGMTVQAVGCVAQIDGKWMLTKATEPVRTRNDALSSGAELEANAKKSGNATVELVDAYPEPAAFKGQKIEVKGLYLAGIGKPPGINLLDLQKVSNNCD
jgi:S-disulfanyl-L-cysteine oxidoreductase SoxD